MLVRKQVLPYRKRGKGIRAAVTLPEFEIAGITMVLNQKVNVFPEPEALLRTPGGAVFPLSRREYVLVMLPSRVLSQRKGSKASMSLYFTAPGTALLHNCPRGTKLEIGLELQNRLNTAVKMILRPADYSKHIEKAVEKLNIL